MGKGGGMKKKEIKRKEGRQQGGGMQMSLCFGSCGIHSSHVC